MTKENSNDLQHYTENLKIERHEPDVNSGMLSNKH
jgi:hypothetical protein